MLMLACKTSILNFKILRKLSILNLIISQFINTRRHFLSSIIVKLIIFRNVRNFRITLHMYCEMKSHSRERCEITEFWITLFKNHARLLLNLSCQFIISITRLLSCFTQVVQWRYSKIIKKNTCLSYWYICMLKQLSTSCVCLAVWICAEFEQRFLISFQ